MTYSAHKYKSISNKIKLYWSHKAWDYSAVDCESRRSLSLSLPTSLFTLSELTFTLDTFSVLGSSPVPFPQFADPPLPNPIQISSSSFKDRIWEGHRPQIGEKSPFHLVGRPPLLVFLAIFPFPRAALGWAACRASGRLARGRPRRAARVRTARRIAASPGLDQVRFLGKGWILLRLWVGNGL